MYPGRETGTVDASRLNDAELASFEIGESQKTGQVPDGPRPVPLGPGRRGLMVGAALAMLLGGLLRLWFLDFPIRYDEAHNYLYFSSRSPTYIASHYESPNNHILHSLMVRLTTPVLGWSPPALRIPALAGGLLLIPLAGWLAWRLSSRSDAVWIAMLSASVSSGMVEYSTNSRGYTWLAVFSTLALILCDRILRESSRMRDGILWGITGALGTYTIPVMVVPCLAMLAVGGAYSVGTKNKSRRRGVRAALLGGAATWLLLSCAWHAPVLANQGLGTLKNSFALSHTVYQGYLNDHGGVFPATWSLWTRHAGPAGIAVLLTGAVAFLVGAIRTGSRGPSMMVGGVTVVSVTAVWWLNVPLVPPNWIFLLPLFFACIAAGWGMIMAGFERWRVARAWRYSLLAVVILAVVDAGLTVSEQTYLSAWEHELVDAESLVAECKRCGISRCALVAPYSPAVRYYALRARVGEPRAPDAPQVQRVYIAANELNPLNKLWNHEVPAYYQFSPPRFYRGLSRCRLYVAERLPEEAAPLSAALGQ